MSEPDRQRASGWAGQLGIVDRRNPSEWLWRLFVLPPDQRRPWPMPVELASEAIRTAAIRALGVRQPGRLRDWILAVLLVGAFALVNGAFRLADPPEIHAEGLLVFGAVTQHS